MRIATFVVIRNLRIVVSGPDSQCGLFGWLTEISACFLQPVITFFIFVRTIRKVYFLEENPTTHSCMVFYCVSNTVFDQKRRRIGSGLVFESMTKRLTVAT
jgi:hypothetical protein